MQGLFDDIDTRKINTDSGLTAPDDDALRRDVELVKSLGFNGVRKHQKIEDPRFLYWADKLGLLVWEEMPSPYSFTNESVGRLTAEWMKVIERDASLKTMAVGLILTPLQAEEALQAGRADLIAVGREALFNPNWPLHAALELGADPDFACWPRQYGSLGGNGIHAPVVGGEGQQRGGRLPFIDQAGEFQIRRSQ